MTNLCSGTSAVMCRITANVQKPGIGWNAFEAAFVFWGRRTERVPSHNRKTRTTWKRNEELCNSSPKSIVWLWSRWKAPPILATASLYDQQNRTIPFGLIVTRSCTSVYIGPNPTRVILPRLWLETVPEMVFMCLYALGVYKRRSNIKKHWFSSVAFQTWDNSIRIV